MTERRARDLILAPASCRGSEGLGRRPALHGRGDLRNPIVCAAVLLALTGCIPDPGTAPLGDAERSWTHALLAARRVGWPYPPIGRIRDILEKAQPPGAARILCDLTYDLADTRTDPEASVAVVAACAEALAAGAEGDPVAASVQLQARAGYPPEVMARTALLLKEAHAKGLDLKDFVRVLDRATVFRTPAWTALQFLKDLLESSGEVPVPKQVDVFEEALGRKGRHLEAQAVLASFREAVRGGFPADDLSRACIRKLRRGLPPSELPAFLAEAANWPAPPLPRPVALRLAAAGLAHGLPDEEVAAFGGYVARNSMDARDALLLAARLEANVRAGLRGRALLEETLENFSGATPSTPSAR